MMVDIEEIKKWEVHPDEVLFITLGDERHYSMQDLHTIKGYIKASLPEWARIVLFDGKLALSIVKAAELKKEDA